MADTSEPSAAKADVIITYCTQCNWLLRAAWMQQELLQTFGLNLGSVALRPSTGGAFEVSIDGEVVWDRRRDGGFPDIRTLKRLVRDRVDPGRSLGHTDRVEAAPEPE